MRAALPILMAAALLPQAAVAAPAAGYTAFDQSIAATKQAMMGDPEHALASALDPAPTAGSGTAVGGGGSP